MASAQGASSSSSSARKKQDHLEAGKRRLEEFRKKKAEGRAKTVPSPGQFPLADVANSLTVGNQPSKVLIDEVLSSSHDAIPSAECTITKVLIPNGRHELSFPRPESIQTKEHEQAPESKEIGDSEPYDGHGGGSDILLGESHEFKPYNVIEEGSFARIVTERSLLAEPRRTDRDHFDYVKNAHLVGNDGVCINNSLEGKERLDGRHSIDTSSNFISHGLGNALDYAAGYSSSKSYDDIHFRTSLPESHDHHRHDISEVSVTSFNDAGVVGHQVFDADGSHINNGLEQKSVLPSTISSLKHETTSKSNYTTSHATTLEPSYRSRPSFLDSILVQKVPSTSPASLPELEKKVPLGSSKISPNNTLTVQSSLPYPATIKPLVNLGDSYQKGSRDHHVGSLLYNATDGKISPRHRGMQRRLETSYALNDDFLALEQHIEDLTQEKFSLQRALDASRTLAESLAAENSSLTYSFNQQGEVVSQLKCDLEKLEEEIRDQVSALEEMRVEYTNAQLECSAADERAKLLASEVIGLEEKALRLRSNELKLENQLENSNAEIASYKKRVFNLLKEHRNLQSTIDALQEEKKVLQSKLLKASSNGKSSDARKASSVLKDASTSTDDLDMLPAGASETRFAGVVSNTIDHGELEAESFFLEQNASCSSMPDIVFPILSSSGFIPSDQFRMVQNINSLIVELALEKEELVQELASKSSHASNLKELNKELSQKLEAQTQRLELLIAQNMAHEQPTMRLTESHNVQSLTTYADEGDEVVERALGWIMKLFPGGSSKRRTSKLL